MCIFPPPANEFTTKYQAKKSICNLLRHFSGGSGGKKPHSSLWPKQMEVRVFIFKGIFIDCDFVNMRKKARVFIIWKLAWLVFMLLFFRFLKCK